MNLPNRADVAIVGAGPVGLTLATALHLHGVEHLVLERNPEGANTSRAAVIHAHTLEVLEPLGVVDQMLARGLKVATFVIHDRDQTLLELGFQDIPSRYPFALMLPQNETEAILLNRLRELGGDVVRGIEVTGIAAEECGATLTTNAGTIRASRVAGCDGMRSIVREQSGISFAGGEYEESFVLADVQMDWPLGREIVSLFLSPDGLAVVAPLPGDHFRIVATKRDAPPEASLEDVQELLDDRGPQAQRAVVHKILWSSRFHVHHRVAQTMWKDRIVLAGDSAHVHSPAGGQGMNTGIQDAVALAEALKAGTDPALAEWSRVRLEIARGVVRFTDVLTRLATLENRSAQLLRNAAMSLIGHAGFLKERIAENISELK